MAKKPVTRKGGDLFIVDDSRRVADFHALRHTFISNLANSGVHPSTAQSLARHCTITLTMDRYTHTVVERQSEALKNLPDLSAPVASEVQATGTDGKSVLAECLLFQGGKRGISRDGLGQNDAQLSSLADERKALKTQGTISVSAHENTGAAGRTRTPDRRIRNPMLYPPELLPRMKFCKRAPQYYSLRREEVKRCGTRWPRTKDGRRKTKRTLHFPFCSCSVHFPLAVCRRRPTLTFPPPRKTRCRWQRARCWRLCP